MRESMLQMARHLRQRRVSASLYSCQPLHGMGLAQPAMGTALALNVHCEALVGRGGEVRGRLQWRR